MDASTVIHVGGFVTEGDVGGFEWDTDREAVIRRLDAIAPAERSEVKTITLDRLALDSSYFPEAITDALDAWPTLWEPVAR